MKIYIVYKNNEFYAWSISESDIKLLKKICDDSIDIERRTVSDREYQDIINHYELELIVYKEMVSIFPDKKYIYLPMPKCERENVYYEMYESYYQAIREVCYDFNMEWLKLLKSDVLESLDALMFIRNLYVYNTDDSTKDCVDTEVQFNVLGYVLQHDYVSFKEVS